MRHTFIASAALVLRLHIWKIVTKMEYRAIILLQEEIVCERTWTRIEIAAVTITKFRANEYKMKK